jgi:hypothetical protein
MEMVEQLLPGVDDRLPSMVARRPQLVLRSPRTLARDIRQLAATLGLTNWAAGRLVAGGSGILELSLTTLAARWGPLFWSYSVLLCVHARTCMCM